MIALNPILEHGCGLESAVIVWSDDDPWILASMQCICADRGFPKVFTARSLVRSIALVRRLRPDLVITDMAKDEGRDAGTALAHAVHTDADVADTPIVLWTGYDPRSDWIATFDAVTTKAVTSTAGLLGLMRSILLHRMR